MECCSDFFSHIFLAYGFDKNITMIRVFFSLVVGSNDATGKSGFRIS